MLETPKSREPLIMEQRSGLDNQQERREKAFRLAAFYVGEGTFIVNCHTQAKGWIHCTPCIRVGNCDPDALDEIQMILNEAQVGFRIYVPPVYKTEHASHAVVSVDGFKRCAQFVNAFGDFFFGKKVKNVELFREYIPRILNMSWRDKNTNGERRELIADFVLQNKALNQKGISRILNDYTLNISERDEDIVSSAHESCSA